MDIDIGTLIYIIITIIVVIVGALGNKKRHARDHAGTDGTHESRGFFETLEERIEGFIDESKEVKDQRSYETSAAEPPVQTIYQEEEAEYDGFGEQFEEETPAQVTDHYSHYAGILDPEKQENLDQIREDAANQDQGVLDVIDIDDMNYPDYYDIVSDFDLGTAVIYSSIINRKEY
ncbi:MAG: hypothetical protein WD578_07860 [Bacteroidales bacterium]